MPENRKVYHVTDSMGDCVIFNIENFKNEPNKKRKGTECDKNIIKGTFEAFGYTVHTVQDPTEKRIKEEMNTSKDHTASSSFICFILSHGTTKNNKTLIATHDNIHMDLNDIIEMADRPDLKGKPKIFVIQACRGPSEDTGVVAGTINEKKQSNNNFDGVLPMGRNPDFLLIFATPSGYVSYRNRTKGSLFIHLICHVLGEHRDKTTVCDLFQRLILTISCIPNRKGKSWFLQVPYLESTLRKSLKLHRSDTQIDISKAQDTRADTIRHRLTGLVQEAQGVNQRQEYIEISDNSVYKKLLLEETSRCYDLSADKIRQCLVINKTTNETAEQDRKRIQSAMQSLKFNVHISKSDAPWKNTFKNCIRNEGKDIGCFFCFIQIDQNSCTSKKLSEIIGALKNESSLLNIPKMFIIQPYDCNSSENETDCSNDSSSTFSVRYSIEADVLIVQVLTVEDNQSSLIHIFCEKYPEHASTVPMMDFLEGILPGLYESAWSSLQPIVSSTMRKHLLITDSFYKAKYSSANEKTICDELEKSANEIEKWINENKKNESSPLSSVDGSIDSLTTHEIKSSEQKTQKDTESSWTKPLLICSYIMIVIGILLVSLNYIGFVLGATRMREHNSRRLTILTFDTIGLTANTVIIYISLPCRLSTVFVCNVLSFVFGVVSSSKRQEYDFKDEVILSVIIALLSLGITVMMALMGIWYFRHNTDTSKESNA